MAGFAKRSSARAWLHTVNKQTQGTCTPHALAHAAQPRRTGAASVIDHDMLQNGVARGWEHGFHPLAQGGGAGVGAGGSAWCGCAGEQPAPGGG